MFKMMKYEYRKGLFPMLMIFSIFGVIELFFLYGALTKDESKTVLGISFLMLASFVAYIFVLIYGVTSYANDLKNKSGYLTFMAPISTYSIIGAKLLSTLLTGMTFVAVIAVLAVIDYSLVANVFELESLLELLKEIVSAFGYDLSSILFGMLAFVVTFLIQFFMVVTVAYLAVSLASTVLQNKKIKGVVSFVLFLVLIVLINKVAVMISSGEMNSYATFLEAMKEMLPVIGFYLACSVVAFLGSGFLLDRKISL